MTRREARRRCRRTSTASSRYADEGSIGRSSPDVEHERAVAIYD